MRGERPKEQLPRQIGRYVLHHQFASGGMAAVYFGQLLGSVGFSRVVAIKRMHHDFAANPAFVKMFVDEAWLAARVQHPNVVQTIDVVADAGELFIVMDYVRGEALSSLLRDARGAVPTAVAASIVGQTLAGLHAAHEAKDEAGRPLGMIHRDVSPQNVLVGVDGLARITDFGIAKAASRLHVTQEKQIKGKLRYMPPEQITSDAKLDRRADIYAMGVVLWETVAGQRLFRGETVEELLLAIMREQVPRLSDRRSDVPKEVDDVIARAVARDPNARFATAEAFQIALENAISPASARAIGEWVVGVAGPSLLEKRAIIDLIEQNAASRTSVRAEVERLAERTSNDDATVVGPPPGLGSDSHAHAGAPPSDETRVSREPAVDAAATVDTTVAAPTARPSGDAAPTVARTAGTEPAPTVRRSDAGQPQPPQPSASVSPTLSITAVSGPPVRAPAGPTLVNAYSPAAAVVSDSTVSGYIALPHAVPLPVPAKQGRGGVAIAAALLAVGAAALVTVLLLGDRRPDASKPAAAGPPPSPSAAPVDPSAESVPAHAPSAVSTPPTAPTAPSGAPPSEPSASPVASSAPSASSRPAHGSGPAQPRPKQAEQGPKVHIPSDDRL